MCIRDREESAYKCTYCGKWLGTAVALKAHEQRHAELSATDNDSAAVGEGGGDSGGAVKKPLSSTTSCSDEKRPFRCEVCGKVRCSFIFVTLIIFKSSTAESIEKVSKSALYVKFDFQ